MTRLFALEELAARCSPPEAILRDKHHIPTGPSRLVESSEERRARQRAEMWEDFLEALRQASVNRLELLLPRRGDDLVSCPWGRLVSCDDACRCGGSGTVTIDFLRDHYEHLVTAVVSCVQVSGRLQVDPALGSCSDGRHEVLAVPCPEAPSKSVPCPEALPKVGRRRMPRRQEHWTGESRLRFANARYAQLLSLLCDREAGAPSPGERVSGHGACGACRRVFPLGQLEIGHVDGALWNTRTCSAWVRAARFWQEHEAGVRLRVLCQGCGVASPECGRS